MPRALSSSLVSATSSPSGAEPRASHKAKKAHVRRAPRQERSQSMVDAIVTAAKQLVIKHGVDGVTTNAVARLAGVSIGSLYQYFPSKRAIVAELRKRHQQAGEQMFRAEAIQLLNVPVQAATRRFVEKMIEVHRSEPALHRALELDGRSPGYGDWERQAVQLIRVYYERHRSELAVTDLDLASFLVSVTTEAITHAAVLERPDLLNDGKLADGIVRLLLGYLTANVEERAPASAE
jgi:AcrR family transcriptional regulator